MQEVTVGGPCWTCTNLFPNILRKFTLITVFFPGKWESSMKVWNAKTRIDFWTEINIIESGF